jgi:hypothetical protein
MGKKVKQEEVVVEKVVDDIYIKYADALKLLDDGIVRLGYQELMEILRYIERKIGHNIPANFSCSSCVFNLMNQFKNLK